MLAMGQKPISKIFEDEERTAVARMIDRSGNLPQQGATRGERIISGFQEQGLRIAIGGAHRFEIFTRDGARVSKREFSADQLEEWLQNPRFYFSE